MDVALFALRVVVGLFFVGHGAQKLWGSFGGHGLQGTAQFFESLGLRPGLLHARSAGFAELGGGLLLLLGLITPLGALLLIAVMTTAIITVHARKGPWVTDGGFEYNAVVMAAAFVLAAGPGNWSLDNAFGWNEIHGSAFALGALGLGILGGILAVVFGRSTKTPGSPTRTARESERRFERTPAEKRAATIAGDERPGVPADPR